MCPSGTSAGGRPPFDGKAKSPAQVRPPAAKLANLPEQERLSSASSIAERRLECGADLAGLGHYEVDFDAGVAWADERCRDIFGLAADRAQGLQPIEFWLEHLHPEDRPRVLERRRRLHEGEVERESIEYRFLHPTRGERWIDHLFRVVRRDARGHAVVTFGVLRDVTSSKRTVESVTDLTRRLLQSHEDQRAMLARELHDDVTQRLALLAIEVGRAELDADGAQRMTLRGIREGLVLLSRDVHSLAYQLHPSIVEDVGLASALQAAAERFRSGGGPVLSLDLDPVSGGLAPDAALCLFRVVQEALNNVTRHAAACAVGVTLKLVDGGLLLSVQDDGVGFDPEAPRGQQSLGLRSMRERMRLLGGTLDVDSALGDGTTVVAWLPCGGEP